MRIVIGLLPKNIKNESAFARPIENNFVLSRFGLINGLITTTIDHAIKLIFRMVAQTDAFIGHMACKSQTLIIFGFLLIEYRVSW